jgi:hypothetical protein
MSKGQIFLMIAVVVILTLILLRTSMSLVNILEGKRHLEMSLEAQQFDNLRSEMLNSVSTGYNSSLAMTENAEEFAGFARTYFKSNSEDLGCLMMFSSYPKPAASQVTDLNLTVANFLGSDISNLTAEFNSEEASFASVPEGSVTMANFTFNTAISRNYTLTVSYQTSGGNEVVQMEIPVEIGKGRIAGLFDIRLSSSGQEQRDKTSWDYTL